MIGMGVCGNREVPCLQVKWFFILWEVNVSYVGSKQKYDTKLSAQTQWKDNSQNTCMTKRYKKVMS